MSKRIVSLLLAFLLIFGTVSVAFAATKISSASDGKRSKTYVVVKEFGKRIKLSRYSAGTGSLDVELERVKFTERGRYYVKVTRVATYKDAERTKAYYVDLNTKSSYTLDFGWGDIATYKITISKAYPNSSDYKAWIRQGAVESTYSWVSYPRYKLTY